MSVPVVSFLAPPPQRSVEEQLDSLSTEEKAKFLELRKYWDSEKREVKYSDYMVLRLLRNSPGKDKFNLASATKVADKYAKWANKSQLHLVTVQTIRSQLETGTLVVSGGANKDGHATLYMKPALFFPGTDNTDLHIQALVYCLSAMSDMNEKTCTMGLSFIANLDGLGWSNFSVGYAKAFLDTLQGRFPCRVRQFIMYNAPFWFGAIWKLLRPMMSPEFAAKIVFLKGPEAIKVEYPDFAHLPMAMGGTLDTDKQLKEFIQMRYKLEGLDPNAPYPNKSEASKMVGQLTAEKTED